MQVCFFFFFNLRLFIHSGTMCWEKHLHCFSTTNMAKKCQIQRTAVSCINNEAEFRWNELYNERKKKNGIFNPLFRMCSCLAQFALLQPVESVKIWALLLYVFYCLLAFYEDDWFIEWDCKITSFWPFLSASSLFWWPILKKTEIQPVIRCMQIFSTFKYAYSLNSWRSIYCARCRSAMNSI